ncbi:MAG: hypothetical protein NTW57_05525 [Methylophilales bacterium]|nr:hypothetical protein [Methylophilales bacterium]
MNRLKVNLILLAACLVLMPFSGFAAGLGKLSVSSSLGEPFKAQIEVLSVSPDEIGSLVATMASEDTYVAQGITRLDIHSNIEIELAQNPDGTPILKLHSSQPVNDSFLDMLIQLDWASGRLIREYTILLAPSDLKVATDEASALPNALPSVEVSDQPFASSMPALVVDAPNFTTKPGDNLNAIAKQLQVDGVSLDQMLIGLFDNNKQAFIQGNMNRLKVGKIIKVPSHDNLVAIDERQAKQLVQVHTANWKAYRGSLASTVALAPTALETDQKQNVAGKITGATDQAVPSKTGSQNIVKLSAGVKGAANPSKEMEAKLTMLQEENTAQAKSLKEAQERTANLEKQIADMRKLLALNSQVMADLQKNTAANIAKPVVQLNTSLTPTVGAQVASTSTTPEAGLVKTPVPTKLAEPVRDLMGMMFRIVDLSMFMATSVVALLLGVLWFIRNKRKKSLEKFEVNALNLGGMRNKPIKSQQVGEQSKDVVMAHEGQSAGNPDVADISNAMEAISLDFELDSAKKSSTKPSPTLSEVLQDQGIQKNAKGFDFSSISFDLDEADTKPAVAKPIMDINTQALSAVDDLQALDLKLDLVSAYIDMGDTEGARILLDEVKKIGNKQQKLRAKKLLAKLV